MAADRLSPLDDAFLHLEMGGAHMHVGAVLVFAGEPPALGDLLAALAGRLHLVPRYRRRLAPVPLGQGRPEWVDDARFALRRHVDHASLPAPGGERELERLVGRLLSKPLSRERPLWELVLVDGLAPAADGEARFALVTKTHHALVDGISSVDVVSLLLSPDPGDHGAPVAGEPWAPAPEPTPGELVSRALAERARAAASAVRALATDPAARRDAARRIASGAAGLAAMARAGVEAPPSPLNVRIGPERRYTWVETDLDALRAVKDALGGTLNDAVLAAVSLALGRWLRGRGHNTDGLVLKAMVPVSVRAEAERGAFGNRVAAMWAPLPVGVDDPRATFASIAAAMAALKASPQADGAQALTTLAGFAPRAVLGRAARMQFHQRWCNVVVTNVPGPPAPLYLLGRRLDALLPVLPLAGNLALGFAVVSYDRRLAFGLLADRDAMPDLDAVARALRAALDDLAAAAAQITSRRRPVSTS